MVVAWVLLSATTVVQARDWMYAKTANFEVYTNAPKVDARILVARLERFRSTFLQILPGAPFHQPRTTVYIFDDERDFRPYKPLYQGKPMDIAGVFRGFPDEVVIAMAASGELDRVIPTIYHEFIHLLMHARGYRLPPWLNEGIAEFYETMEFSGDEVLVGKHNPLHITQLTRGRMMPLAKLFAVTHGSPDYNESSRMGMFYAQSWAFVHYCLTADRKGRKRGEGFNELLAYLQLGYSAEESVQRAFGMSAAELEADLGAYVRGGRYTVGRYNIPGAIDPKSIEFQKADDFARDVALTNLKWRIHQNGSALLELRQWVARNPESPRPHEIIATLLNYDGERLRSMQSLEEAAKLGSENPYVYAKLAEDSLRQYLSGVRPSFRLPPEASAELRAWLDRAVQLAPNYTDAWDWLALTEAFSAKPRPAMVQTLQEKHMVFGNRPRLLAGFSLLALRIDQKTFAEHLADSLLATPSVMKRPTARSGVRMQGVKNQNSRNWMQRAEYYPEVRGIAQAVKRELAPKDPDAKKPARGEYRPAEVVIEFIEE